MSKIALGVSSSISIYKACEILRGFQKEGVEVHVLMTKNATRFISPYLFSSLSRNRTIVNPFEEEFSGEIDHIALAKDADLFLVAPATANIIAKFAAGTADDFLSTFFLAVRSPVLIAPAMNEAMFQHPQTQANIRKLRETGVEFVEPGRGYQACGDEGWGRLAPVEDIIRQGLALMKRAKSLQGRCVLVTAGPTREFMDPVRFISNPSTGKMGHELAAEALRRGAKVVLVTGPSHLIPPAGADVVRVMTAAEMKIEVEKRFAEADVVVMAAAVSDFKFKKTAPQKVKKESLAHPLDLIPTDDILAGLGARKDRAGKILVGFAAETTDILRNASDKLRKKRLDLIVANDVRDKEIGFASDDNRVTMIDRRGKTEPAGKASKREISRKIWDRIEVLLDKKS